MHFLLLTLAEEWEQPGILGHPPNITSIFPPLGLLNIGAVLEENGHSVEIIDFGSEKVTKELLEKNLKISDAVGMSVYTNTYKKSAELANFIKEFDPKIPLIIGGPHCTFLKAGSLKDIPKADIAVELEGEHVILEIIKFLERKEQISAIPGIFYRNSDGIKSGKPFKIIQNMDSLPFPARHLVEKYDYGNFPYGYTAKKKFTSMLTSRGCAYRCRFCSRYSNVIQEYGFRQRSAENVIEELLLINEKYRSVAIVDDNFLADKNRSLKIFDFLIKAGIELDIMIVGARVDTANKTLYEKMKKAGVSYISFGIESGNQDVLDYYNKNVTLEQIRKAITLGRKMNFFLSSSFIFGGPTETKKHLENTMKFMRSLPLDVAVIRPFYYDMGSEFWNEAVKKGKISENEYVVRVDSNRGLGNLPIEDVDKYLKKAYRGFYFNPRYVFGQVFRALKNKDILRLKYNLKVAMSSQLKNIL